MPDAVNAALPEMFSDLSAAPGTPSFDLQNGTPVVIPPSRASCAAVPTAPTSSGRRSRAAAGTATLEVQVTEPELTTEEAQASASSQPVGGNNAWRNGAGHHGRARLHHLPRRRPAPGHQHPPHRRPRPRHRHRRRASTFSINEHVGQRTAAKGFVAAGAIRDGEHVDEIGGGVSQFATTTFNAAYFAGLDITDLPGPHRVLRPLPARPRGDDGLPGARPRSSPTTRPTAS